MTVIEVRNKILEHFLTESYFCDKEHLEKLNLGSYFKNKSDLAAAMVLEALRDLEAAKLIRKCLAGGFVFWVLEQPLASYPQTVTLSIPTITMIADTINKYRDSCNITGDVCDKTKIKEEDIQNLVYIIMNLMKGSKNE